MTPRDFDLHCHTNVSDGFLAPAELLQLASESGIKTLAITDHDSVDAYRQLHLQMPASCRTRLLPAVEMACNWEQNEIHVVGLDIDPLASAITSVLDKQQAVRYERASQIHLAIEKFGVNGLRPVFTEVLGQGVPGRLHFARALVENGNAKDVGRAFKQILNKVKTARRHSWVDLEEAVASIQAAGGIAILAHPHAYGFTRSKLGRLVAAFVDACGDGLEVSSPGADSERMAQLSRYCQEFDLLASGGSDFHGLPGSWRKLGFFPELPRDCSSVWTAIQ